MLYLISKYKCVYITLLSLLLITKNSIAQKPDHLSKEVTITLAADSLVNTLHKIALKTQVNFAYASEHLYGKHSPEINGVRMQLSTLLNKVLFGTNLSFMLVGNDIVILPKKPITRTLHGHILDKASGEALMGATVQIPSLKIGVVTNQYGFYSITVSEGNYEVQVSNTGYQTRLEVVQLHKDLQKEIELYPQEHHLKEVEIRQSSLTPHPILHNEQTISQRKIYNSAYYAGETDVMKKLQMENGVKAITEGSSGLYIRGGNADQNLILLDEAIVYNPSHLYGLVFCL